MKPLEFFGLLLITTLAMIGLSQIPLIQDLITASGFSSSEVWSGIGTILLIFYAVVYAVKVK